MEYLITGNTWRIKEDLKANGCKWDPAKKAWVTPNIVKNELRYRMIKSLADTMDADMNPVILSKDCQDIQDIINK